MQVKILDSTLREGEQTPGVDFSVEQKLEIARALDAFGVENIEAGHPVVSKDIAQALKQITRENLDAEILAHSRCLRTDIDAALACEPDWIGLFYSVTNQALEQRFRTDFDHAIEIVTDSIEYAKAHGVQVRYTPEDTVRAPWEHTIRIAHAAVEAGADRLCIADTTGAMIPSQLQTFVQNFRSELPHIELEMHCHNDLGLANANALAGVEAGANVIATCVNGMGERAGIASLAEVTAALHFVHHAENTWNFQTLCTLSDLVESHSGIQKSPQAPITGETAFTHNAGLHVSALMKDPTHYENILAEEFGRERNVALGKFSGRDNARHHLAQNGHAASEVLIQRVLQEAKNGNNL